MNFLNDIKNEYTNDEYSVRLFKSLKNAKNYKDIVQSFLDHSISVRNYETAPDYLNGCDGDSSPLSQFVFEILDQKNFDKFKYLIDMINSDDDFQNFLWIVTEINCLFWYNPVEYHNQIIYFLNNPFLSSYFNFWSGVSIDREHYLNIYGVIYQADKATLEYLSIYKQINSKSPRSRFNNHKLCTWKEYLNEVEEDLREWRNVNEKDFPLTFDFINKEKSI